MPGLISYYAGIQLDIGEVCAGLLGGLVAICAPCANVHPWEGLVIGLIAGPVTIGCKSHLTVSFLYAKLHQIFWSIYFILQNRKINIELFCYLLWHVFLMSYAF